eukprot:3671537-Amphidinium_carterae.1
MRSATCLHCQQGLLPQAPGASDQMGNLMEQHTWQTTSLRKRRKDAKAMQNEKVGAQGTTCLPVKHQARSIVPLPPTS